MPRRRSYKWVLLGDGQISNLIAAGGEFVNRLYSDAHLGGNVNRAKSVEAAMTALERALRGQDQPPSFTALELEALLTAVSSAEAGDLAELLNNNGRLLAAFERGAAKLRKILSEEELGTVGRREAVNGAQA